MDSTEIKKSLLAINAELQAVENSIGLMVDKVKLDIANLYRQLEPQATKPVVNKND